MRGLLLWAKHIKLFHAILAGLLSICLTRYWLDSYNTEGNSLMSILFFSLPTSIFLLIPFIQETVWDRISIRPYSRRKILLLGIIILASAFLAFISSPHNFNDHGMLATFRNILTLIGIGLISLPFLPRWLIWLFPLIVSLLSLIPSLPLYPSSIFSAFFFLRMPETLISHGTPNLSWFTAAILFISGTVLYWHESTSLRHYTRTKNSLHHPLENIAILSPTSRHSTGQYPLVFSGINRATFSIPLAFFSAIPTLFLFSSSISDWGGRADLLWNLSWQLVVFVSITGIVTGCITAQFRWRSSLIEWQKVSNRSLWEHALIHAPLPCLFLFTHGIIISIFFGISVYSVHSNTGNHIATHILFQEISSITPHITIYFFAASLSLTLGFIIGSFIKYFWVAPLSALIVFACFLSSPPTLPSVDDPLIHMSAEEINNPEKVTCYGTNPQVCSSSYNSAYLPAASNTLHNLYSPAWAQAYLPQRVFLTDHAGRSFNFPAVRIGLAQQRGLNPPTSLNEATVKQDFIRSLKNACTPPSLIGEYSPESLKTTERLAIKTGQYIFAPQPLEDYDPAKIGIEDSFLPPQQVVEELQRAQDCLENT